MGVTFKKPSFAAGEISPRVAARDDQERYHIGLEKCRNWRILKEGGAEKRPGFRYLGKVKYPTKKTRVIELERDADTTYGLEFGDLYVRIWKDRVNVLQLDAEPSANQLQLIDSDYVWMKSGSGTNEWYLLSSYAGPPEVFGKPTGAKRHQPLGTSDTLAEGALGSLAIDEWGWGDNDSLGFSTLYVRDAAVDLNDYTSNAYRMIVPGPLEFVTPYLEADIALLKFDDSASVVYITHGSYPPATLSRLSDTSWIYALIDFDSAGIPVDTYGYSSEFPANSPGTDWLIEYSITRLSEEGIESSKKSAFVKADDQPDPATPPDELGTLGPVWTLESTAQGDARNVILNAADYEWIDLETYRGNVDDISAGEVFFLCKKGTGLDGPAGGSTNLAEDPGIFDGVDQTGAVQCYDVTGTPSGVSRTRKGFTPAQVASLINDSGLNNNGHWFYGLTSETGFNVALALIDEIGSFQTLWIMGDAGTLVDPSTRDFELTLEVDAGYNLYRRFAKVGSVDGNSGATWFPWGRLAALDAYGGTHRVLNNAAYPSMADEKLEISGAYLDTGSVTPDESREPPELLKDFNEAGKYPSVVAFVSQRLVLAATDEHQNRIRLSVSGDFFDFVQADSSEDDDPIKRDLTTANKILHMIAVGTGSLLVFTTGGEWRVWGQGGSLTPSTINSAEGPTYGSSDVTPLKVGGLVLYVTKLGQSVNAIVFDFGSDAYQSDPISTISGHLIEKSQIAGWAYAETPNKTIYGYLDDGSFIGVTFDQAQEMNAWHRHDTKNGLVKSFASVRAGKQDDIYAIVSRTINGQTQQYMEVLENGDVSDQYQALFVDSGLSLKQPEIPATEISPALDEVEVVNTLSVGDEVVVGGFDTTTPDKDNPTNSYLHGLQMNGVRARIVAATAAQVTLGDIVTGEPMGFSDLPASSTLSFWIRKLVKTIYGFDHLEGQEIGVMADGRELEAFTVTNARITLESGAADVVGGLIIDSELELLSFSGNAGQNTLDGKKRNVSKITAHVLNTRGLKVGLEPDKLVDFKIPRHNPRFAEELMTGQMEVTPKGKWTDTGKVYFKHDSPLPATLLAVTPEYDLGN